ncbi:RnfH family protein [Oceanimonas sp. GK1]|uniref:RnfH family protein n=1 Tax=Oceanimonas sp. (strain GK1 / IBRC-M 10197) TaxID=511062 RepID=UPI0006808742
MPSVNGPGRCTAVNLIQVEVVYALPAKQTVLTLRVAPDACVREIIEQSGILRQFPEIDLEQNAVGIFSRQVKLDQTVFDGDRIEIYRPLLADPKEIRRRRAEQAKEEGRADKVTGGRPDPKRTRQ